MFTLYIDCLIFLAVVASSNAVEAFKGVQYAILLGGFPRGPGMERKDLIARNTAIFKSQGEAINVSADKNIKVLVVANPANTNCLVLMTNAPSIPRTNFSCLTRLDMNRCRSQIALQLTAKTNTTVTHDEVKNCIIWGNHSSTQVPDVNHATYNGQNVKKILDNEAYLNGEFIKLIQQRGKAIIDVRGLSSAFSAAQGAANAMRDWVLGTKEGEVVSMGICSDGNIYGIQEDLIYSFPCKCSNGQWTIDTNFKPLDSIKPLLEASMRELLEEKSEAFAVLGK